MRRAFIILCLCLLLVLGACGSSAQPEPAAASPTPTDGLGAGSDGPEPTGKPTEPAQTPAPTQSKSRLYDPSIFVIEASGSWRDELAAEYFADYECEIYLHKIDQNDNREVAGSYEGVFWMKSTLDTSGFIEKMFGDAPIELSFDAGGEAVCDNLAISLHAEDDKAWVNYSIMGEDGNPLPLTQDTPVAKGSFVAVAKQLYLEVHGSGAQGETVDYSSNAGEGDVFDVNYVIHVQPDSMESGTERKVTINLSGEGFSKTLEGVMRRLPGYTEDVSDYYSSSGYLNSAWRHLQ